MQRILYNPQELILASGSPRRRSFFQDLGLVFRVVAAAIEEKPQPAEKPVTYIERLAREKAENVAEQFPDQWIVAADTVVCCDESILEKPVDSEDALKMLMRLRGREHVVRSSVCLLHKRKSIIDGCSVATRVKFWRFTEDMARNYVQTGEPMDKAGSYGIQGQGAFLVREIIGSYSNVVGMPLVECIEMFIRHGVLKDNVAE